MAMDSKNSFEETIGVIGAGSFGTAIANILAENSAAVLLYVRSDERKEAILKFRTSSGQKLADNITVTRDLAEVAQKCEVIFPIGAICQFSRNDRGTGTAPQALSCTNSRNKGI